MIRKPGPVRPLTVRDLGAVRGGAPAAGPGGASAPVQSLGELLALVGSTLVKSSSS
jgi:hypothetical protein